MKKKTNKQKTARRGGFTLLEILVVILIIGLLLGVVGTNVFKALFTGQRRSIEMQIKQFEGALNFYRLEHNKYPESLEELVEPDVMSGEPYLKGGKLPLDPWMMSTSTDSFGEFDFMSLEEATYGIRLGASNDAPTVLVWDNGQC